MTHKRKRTTSKGLQPSLPSVKVSVNDSIIRIWGGECHPTQHKGLSHILNLFGGSVFSYIGPSVYDLKLKCA